MGAQLPELFDLPMLDLDTMLDEPLAVENTNVQAKEKHWVDSLSLPEAAAAPCASQSDHQCNSVFPLPHQSLFEESSSATTRTGAKTTPQLLQSTPTNGSMSEVVRPGAPWPCTERHGDGWEIFTTPSTSCHSCGGPLMDLGLLERTNGDDNDLFNWPPMELPENELRKRKRTSQEATNRPVEQVITDVTDSEHVECFRTLGMSPDPKFQEDVTDPTFREDVIRYVQGLDLEGFVTFVKQVNKTVKKFATRFNHKGEVASKLNTIPVRTRSHARMKATLLRDKLRAKSCFQELQDDGEVKTYKTKEPLLHWLVNELCFFLREFSIDNCQASVDSVDFAKKYYLPGGNTELFTKIRSACGIAGVVDEGATASDDSSMAGPAPRVELPEEATAEPTLPAHDDRAGSAAMERADSADGSILSHDEAFYLHYFCDDSFGYFPPEPTNLRYLSRTSGEDFVKAHRPQFSREEIEVGSKKCDMWVVRLHKAELVAVGNGFLCRPTGRNLAKSPAVLGRGHLVLIVEDNPEYFDLLASALPDDSGPEESGHGHSDSADSSDQMDEDPAPEDPDGGTSPSSGFGVDSGSTKYSHQVTNTPKKAGQELVSELKQAGGGIAIEIEAKRFGPRGSDEEKRAAEDCQHGARAEHLNALTRSSRRRTQWLAPKAKATRTQHDLSEPDSDCSEGTVNVVKSMYANVLYTTSPHVIHPQQQQLDASCTNDQQQDWTLMCSREQLSIKEGSIHVDSELFAGKISTVAQRACNNCFAAPTNNWFGLDSVSAGEGAVMAARFLEIPLTIPRNIALLCTPGILPREITSTPQSLRQWAVQLKSGMAYLDTAQFLHKASLVGHPLRICLSDPRDFKSTVSLTASVEHGPNDTATLMLQGCLVGSGSAHPRSLFEERLSLSAPDVTGRRKCRAISFAQRTSARSLDGQWALAIKEDKVEINFRHRPSYDELRVTDAIDHPLQIIRSGDGLDIDLDLTATVSVSGLQTTVTLLECNSKSSQCLEVEADNIHLHSVQLARGGDLTLRGTEVVVQGNVTVSNLAVCGRSFASISGPDDSATDPADVQRDKDCKRSEMDLDAGCDPAFLSSAMVANDEMSTIECDFDITCHTLVNSGHILTNRIYANKLFNNGNGHIAARIIHGYLDINVNEFANDGIVGSNLDRWRKRDRISFPEDTDKTTIAKDTIFSPRQVIVRAERFVNTGLIQATEEVRIAIAQPDAAVSADAIHEDPDPDGWSPSDVQVAISQDGAVARLITDETGSPTPPAPRSLRLLDMLKSDSNAMKGCAEAMHHTLWRATRRPRNLVAARIEFSCECPAISCAA